MHARSLRARESGFTLVEILIALSIATVLTLLMFGAVVPWLNFKHKIDTEHRLEELKNAVTTTYQTYAMQVDSQASTTAVFAVGAGPTQVVSSTIAPAAGAGPGAAINTCADNTLADSALTPYLSTSPVNGIRDGYSNYICILISQSLSQAIEGVVLYYRVIALVSAGQDGKIDTGTTFNASTGTLTLSPTGDDVGVVVSGFPIEYQLYKDSKTRLDRVADMYGTYFTSRFQGNVARDYSIDFFGGCSQATSCSGSFDYDSVATLVPLTSNTWQTTTWTPNTASMAAALGLGVEEETSAWTTPAGGTTPNNTFEYANEEISPAPTNSPQVQEPADKTANLPPYTALIRMMLPTPSDLPQSYATKVVTGTY